MSAPCPRSPRRSPHGWHSRVEVANEAREVVYGWHSKAASAKWARHGTESRSITHVEDCHEREAP
jgi:hypothetical protein